jgi:mannose-6-phosphate isomerase
MNDRIKHISQCLKSDKPWGYEVLWACPDSGDYIGKIMCINPDQRMSLQYHNKKEETIYVMAGILKLWESEDDNQYVDLSPGSIYHVKPKQIHRFGAGSSQVMLIEVSTSQLSDVVRIKDDYER